MLAVLREFRLRAALLVGFVGLMWVAELIDLVFLRGSLDQLGIRPRETRSLWGIPLAPFLHGGLRHLIANTAPLLVLGWLVLVRRRVDFVLLTVAVTLAGGLGVWLFAPSYTIHIGASGVAFGYLGYLIARAWFERSLTSLALALLAGVLYGGALAGLLPGQRGISWEGHLFGFAAGGGMGALSRRPRLIRVTRRPRET
ncbi:MAG TPA: rhomboid family intramembrane serine protease [Chloroflexota bacterium]|nr:rhomboid family intramembrane serine protease [Chloroflexota bacterium]